MKAGAAALYFTPVRISSPQPLSPYLSTLRQHHRFFDVVRSIFCIKSASEVNKAYDLSARACRGRSRCCVLDREPTNFHQGYSNPHVGCSSSPCLNTPYIYINIHIGKKEYSIISWRLMNLSRSRPAFFFFFKRYLSCRRRLVYQKSLSLHKTNQT